MSLTQPPARLTIDDQSWEGMVVIVAGKITVDAGGGPVIVSIGSVVILVGVLMMLYIFVTRRMTEGTDAQAEAALT